MSKLLISITLLLPLMQFFVISTAASVYKSHTSDITKSYHPATAAGTTTAAIFPKTVKSYASEYSGALLHTHSPRVPHIPCKKHLHPPHHPHFFVPAAPAHYYRQLYSPAAPVSVPVSVPASPTIYLLSAPPAAALSNYRTAALPAYTASTATRSTEYAAAAASAAYYDNFHATSAVVRPPLPYTAYASASAAAYDFPGNFAWQQALMGNFAQ